MPRNIKRRNSIRVRFTYLLLISSFVLYVLIVSVIILRFRTDSVKRAQYLAENLASEYANMATANLNIDMNLARGLNMAIKTNWENGNASNKDFYKTILKNAAKENPNIMAVWVNLEMKMLYPDYPHNYGRERYTLVTLKGQETMVDEQLNMDGDDLGSDYLALKQSKIFEFSEPYWDTYGNDTKEYLMSSVCVPILDDNNTFMGLTGYDFALERLAPFVEQLVPYKGTVAMVASNKGLIVAHPNKEMNMKSIETIDTGGSQNLTDIIQKGKVNSFKVTIGKENYFVAMAPILLSKSSTPWSLVLQLPEKEVLATVNSTIILSIIICFIGLIILGTIVYYLTLRIEKPLTQCITFAKEIGSGNLSKSLQINNHDEIGLLADSLNQMVDHLRTIVVNIAGEAQTLTQTAYELSQSSQSLIGIADNQENSSKIAEKAITELSNFITQSTQSTLSAENLSNETTKNVTQSSQQFKTSIDSMIDIAERIQIINDIAFQTNILALNAAVEAARAGDSGRGFAVVASEVRKLADRSKESAQEIIMLANETKQNSEKAGETLNETFSKIGEYTTIVSGMHQHTLIQHQSISHIVDTISQLKVMSGTSTQHAINIDRFALELKKQSEELSELTSRFSINRN